MPSLIEVKAFLEDLHSKMAIWGVTFLNRNEYFQDLIELEQRGYKLDDLKQVIMNLKPENYYQGPIKDTNNIPPRGDLWVFGKFLGINKPEVKDKKELEYYIKVQRGLTNQGAVCISFHRPKYKIKYPNLL